MARPGAGIFNRLADVYALRRWSRIADSAHAIPLDRLRSVRARGREIQGQIGRVIAVADERSMLPPSAMDQIRNTDNADWQWRPDIWKTKMGQAGCAGIKSGEVFADNTKVFHDCDLCENTLRQVPNTRSIDLAPFGLCLDFLGFSGNFFSVVVDLPPPALSGLSKKHVLRADIDLESESGVTIFARLNLRQGPNTETMVVEISSNHPAVFDLGFSDVSENHVDAAWIEVIFEEPRFNEIVIRDLTLCRHPRAEI